MKQDLTLIHNYEQISQRLFDHGMNVGKEKAIMERQNIPSKTSPAPSNHAGNGGIPKSWAESLSVATVRSI
jgi:hypothetical protein